MPFCHNERSKVIMMKISNALESTINYYSIWYLKLPVNLSFHGWKKKMTFLPPIHQLFRSNFLCKLKEWYWLISLADQSLPLAKIHYKSNKNWNHTFVNSWLACDIIEVSIFGYPPRWCSTAGKFDMCLRCGKAIAAHLLWILQKMDVPLPMRSFEVKSQYYQRVV